MKFTSAAFALLLTASASAFTPQKTQTQITSPVSTKSSLSSDQSPINKPLFDPLGLYPKDAPERKEGLIQPLESAETPDRSVKDPLSLYTSNKDEVDDKPMSASLPFLQRPAMLDGSSVPGDRGFDPFNFAGDAGALQWQRTAEIKHARIAMLAAVGWPLSELFDKPLAAWFNLKPLLVFQDRAPSVLNGGLDRTPGAYWAAVLGVAFAIESMGLIREFYSGGYVAPGDLGFDPLKLAGKTKEERFYQAEAELFNGRLAMLAITGYALQEWWSQNSVVNAAPIFFKPIWAALEQLQDAAGNAI